MTIVPAIRAQDQIGEPCRPDQLRVATDVDTVAGNLYISVRMTNTSNRACVLRGAPRVATVSSAGDEVLSQVRWPIAEGDAGMEKGLELITLAPGTQGLFVIHTLNRTGFSESHPCASSLRIYLSDGVPGNEDNHAIATVTVDSCGEISISGYRFT